MTGRLFQRWKPTVQIKIDRCNDIINIAPNMQLAACLMIVLVKEINYMQVYFQCPQTQECE